MNKNGFTLVELIAVLVLITLVSFLTFPNMRNLMKSNNAKEFETYEDMMVEYTKTIPNYRSKNYICLSDLKMKPLNDSMSCHGYVKITQSSLTPYLYCTQNGSDLYKTKYFNESGNLTSQYEASYGC